MSAPKRKPRTFKVWVSQIFRMHTKGRKIRCAVAYFDKPLRGGKLATLTLTGKGWKPN